MKSGDDVEFKLSLGTSWQAEVAKGERGKVYSVIDDHILVITNKGKHFSFTTKEDNTNMYLARDFIRLLPKTSS